MPNKIKRPKGLSGLVINEIKQLVINNKLQAGDKLPTEKELVEMFGVGRSSVREAVQTLQGLGIVKVIQGKGTFLTEASLDVLKDQLAFTLGYGSTGMADLTEARRILEVAAVQMAAKRATKSQLKEIAAAVNTMGSCQSQEEVLQAGTKFHYAVIRAAQNPLITKMYDAIWGVIHETFANVFRSQVVLELSVADHKYIFELIASGDAEAAGRAMEEHLQALEDRLKQHDSWGKLQQDIG